MNLKGSIQVGIFHFLKACFRNGGWTNVIGIPAPDDGIDTVGNARRFAAEPKWQTSIYS
jgi:hypothetical protein